MQFTLKINCDNDAFEDSGEIARLLRKVADRVDGCAADVAFEGGVVDGNGNRCGDFSLAEEA